MNNEATNKINHVVEITKKRALDAEKKFSESWNIVQKMASQPIDVFGANALSQVTNIITNARSACNDLYTSLQSLVISLDSNCRPLFNEGVDLLVLKEIADTLKWLNDGSEINNDFTAQFNTYNLGDMACIRYAPSIETKMIQKFWEDKYLSIPDLNERLAQEKEKQKAKEIEVKEKYEAENEKYEKEMKVWKAECEKIVKIREQKQREKINEEKEKLTKDLDKKHSQVISGLKKQIKNAEKNIEEATIIRDSLGFFAFGEKNKQKSIIAQQTQIVEKLKKQLNDESESYSKAKEIINKKIEKIEETIYENIRVEYPMPIKPYPPHKTPINKDRTKMSPSMLEIEYLKDEILEVMCYESKKLYTVKDIIELLGNEQLSNQRISTCLRQLMDEYKIERLTEDRIAYFRLL